MNKIALIATGLLIATSAAASANSIDATKDRQADRIEHGRETGKITWTEGLKLRAEQSRIARTEAKYEAKGYLTKSERRERPGHAGRRRRAHHGEEEQRLEPHLVAAARRQVSDARKVLICNRFLGAAARRPLFCCRRGC